MLNIQEVKNKSAWESFLNIPFASFPLFQSWSWGEVQKRLGYKVLRLGVYKDLPAGRHGKKLVAVCQIVDVNARRGHYLHLRHGPVLAPYDQEVFDVLLSYVKNISKEKKATFVRMSPVVKKEHVDFKMLKGKGFLDSPMHNMDAEICWVLDIGKSEDLLLKEMRKTHRYLIRKASNLNIKIIRTKKVSDINNFLNLYSNLSIRKHFVPHRGIREEFLMFGKDDQALLFLASYKKKIIAGAFVLFVGNMGIYHHGASLEGYRDIPVSYLLQWEAIKEAKKRGKKLYNFWGIAPFDNKSHPWAGLTLFKKGFGGRKEEFLHAQDLPLSIWYWKTYLIESISRWLKGY